jgi:predicted RNA-binding Zn-ribbon protein involved in translation (DUF1610 family)
MKGSSHATPSIKLKNEREQNGQFNWRRGTGAAIVFRLSHCKKSHNTYSCLNVGRALIVRA